METEGTPLRGLGRAWSRALTEHPSGVDLAVGRRRLLEAAVLKPAPAKQNRRAAFGLFALAAGGLAVATAVVVPSLGRPRPLTFEVGGRAGSEGAWIATGKDRSLPVRFSDGTRINLQPESRARVEQITALGARIVLERGRVSANVLHLPAASWRVGAGPFEVRVTGTEFDVSWEPAREELSVSVERGGVSVLGPVTGMMSGLPVGAGALCRAYLREGRMEILSTVREATESVQPVEEPVVAPAEATAGEPSPPPRRRTVPSWKRLLEAGRYRDSIAAVRQIGVENIASSASAGDLLALGRAARLAGETPIASRSLLACRHRFAGAPSSATAAYLLGTLAADRQGDAAAAATWFATYLREDPSGALAREAAGRLIEAEQRAGHPEAARTAARSYVSRYPSGPFAGQAARLLDR